MLSVPHLIVIFIVALVVFGPEKIPELARNLGKIMAEFRRVTGDLRSTFEGHLRDLEREADQRRSVAAVPGPAAVPAVTSVPAADAGAVAPGTVPSNPPNADAGAATNPAPPSAPDPAPKADSSVAYTQPGDPMHDPYLMSMDFPEHASEPANGNKPAEPAHESERVTDGDGRNS